MQRLIGMRILDGVLECVGLLLKVFTILWHEWKSLKRIQGEGFLWSFS